MIIPFRSAAPILLHLSVLPPMASSSFSGGGGWSGIGHRSGVAGHRDLAELTSRRRRWVKVGGSATQVGKVRVVEVGNPATSVVRRGGFGRTATVAQVALRAGDCVEGDGVLTSAAVSSKGSSGIAASAGGGGVTPSPVGADAAGDDWSAYLTEIETVAFTETTYTRKDSEEDIAAVRDYLFTRGSVVITPNFYQSSSDREAKGVEDLKEGVKDDFSSKIEAQRATFLSSSGMTLNQHKILLKVLGYVGNRCAKFRNYRPLLIAWDKIKEAGCTPRENVLSTFLYALSEADGSEVSEDAQVNGGECDSPVAEVIREIATFHDMMYKPTEKTLSLRVKLYVAQGDASGAEGLLDLLPELKLRTFLPVLELYCRQGDITSALTLYRKMQRSPGVIFEAETHSVLIASVAENGYFRADSDPILGAEDLGFSPAYGPALLDQLVSEMAENVLEITPECALLLQRSFLAGFGVGTKTLDEEESLAICTDTGGDTALVADRILVNETTAVCSTTGAHLRLIKLEGGQRQSVHDALLQMANMQYEVFSAKLEAMNQKVETVADNYAAEHLSSFAKWLDEREGDPFTAVVDGANVAFYGQGVVNHHQVQLIVEALEKMGENPLVILPEKYTTPKFYIRKGFVQELPQVQLDLVKGLGDQGKLYTVPKRCLDDYYWMLASVSSQRVARNGTNLAVSPNSDGRWPGLRPIIISNDRMRDHKLELLQPRLFRRWYSSHIIRYDLTPFPGDESEREICFSAADFFSREIQVNPNPTTPTEVSNCSSRSVWHFPVRGWEINEQFCLRLPVQCQ